jgi:hypothetical protein
MAFKFYLTIWNINYFMYPLVGLMAKGIIFAMYRWSAGVLPERYQGTP